MASISFTCLLVHRWIYFLEFTSYYLKEGTIHENKERNMRKKKYKLSSIDCLVQEKE